MELKKNKGGMFFTLFVIIVLSLLVLTITFLSFVEERKIVRDRINSLNSFVFSVEEDIPRKIYTTAFRVIFLLEKRIIDRGTYVLDTDAVFQEAFINGTIEGETDSNIEVVMSGAKLSDIEDSLRENARRINANVSISSPSFILTQEDPWHITIRLSANLFINDLTGLAIWNRTLNISVLVPIDSFEDPLYLINTHSLVTNKIKKTPYSVFVSGSDISNLSKHVQNSYYVESNTAPSFLDRLEGNLGPSENGIESLVNLAELSAQGITTKDKSVVDYIYFSDSNPESRVVIPSGMPSWFKLDSSHLSAYQVSWPS